MSEDTKAAAAARSAYVEALEEERRGYVARGLKDRVTQVDAELERVGAKPAGRTAAKKSNAKA